MNHFKIMIVDDDASARESLAFLVASAGWPTVTCGSPHEALSRLPDSQLGCLISDYRMPHVSGLDLIREVGELDPSLPLILVSAYATVPVVWEGFRHGIVDFLEKPTDEERLLERVAASVSLRGQRLDAERERAGFRRRLDSLTSREREVWERLIQARSMKEIAAELRTSVQTIAKHRTRIHEKMDVQTDIDLVRQAVHSPGPTRPEPGPTRYAASDLPPKSSSE